MPKKVTKSKKSPARKVSRTTTTRSTHPLFREIPQLNALVIVLFGLLAILYIAIYLTRFA